METTDLIDMAQVIAAAINAGADQYDIAMQLNKLYTKGVQDGIKSMKEALVA